MATIQRSISNPSAEMCFLGQVDPAGSASSHTGYRIGFANGANYFVARVTAKTVKVKGKLTSASTGASVPRFYINGSEVLSGTGNPFYNTAVLTDATIYSNASDTTVLVEIYWPGSGIPFFLGTPSAGTTGFDGVFLTLEADGTPTIVCPPALVGTAIKLDFTADAASPTASKAHGELRGSRSKSFVIKPNATDVTVVSPAGLAAYLLTDTARNYAHTGSRADDTLVYHTVSLSDPDPSLLDGSLIGTIGMQAVRVATGMTPGDDLWIGVGNSASNVSNPYWLILDGGTESLETRNTFPDLWIGYDGGSSGGLACMPRFATEQGALGYNWFDGNNALIQTYESNETRSGIAIFGNHPTSGWSTFATFVGASKSAKVNIYAQVFSYEDNTAVAGDKYIAIGALGAAGANLQLLTTPGQLQEQLEQIAISIRSGNNWFGSSVGAIAKIDEIVYATYGNLSHNTYDAYHAVTAPNAPYRVDAALYESVIGSPPANKYSTGARVAYRTCVEDAVTEINGTHGLTNLAGTGPFAVFLDLGEYKAYVEEYDEAGISDGSCYIPGVPDGTFANRPFAVVTSSLGDLVHESAYGSGIKSAFCCDAYLRVKGIITSAAPTVIGMTVPVAGDRILIPFSRDVLNYNGLSFTKNGSPLTGTISRVNTRQYQFVLSGDVIYDGNTVAGSYNAGTGNITELYGTEMATFSGTAVTNNSTQEAPVTPGGSGNNFALSANIAVSGVRLRGGSTLR